jgi:hypothetical protein
MATGAQHPLTRARYEAEGTNAVRVTDGARWGLFDRTGGWIEGELRQCDPQMCIWLTGLAVVEQRMTAAEEAR